jgi:hypothetical protein
MSTGRGRGPRSRAAWTAAPNAAAVAGGMLPTQARSISWTRSVSAARFSRSNFDRLVIVPRFIARWDSARSSECTRSGPSARPVELNPTSSAARAFRSYERSI